MINTHNFETTELTSLKLSMTKAIAQERGLTVGSSSVVSSKAHSESFQQSGIVNILLAKDAGMTYLESEKPGQFLHIDILHLPAYVDVTGLSRQIKKAIYPFLEAYFPGNEILHENQMLRLAFRMAGNIYIETGTGQGTILEPHVMRTENPKSHIHILAKLQQEHYPFVKYIVEETEKFLVLNGAALRPVQHLIHVHEKKAAKKQVSSSQGIRNNNR